MTVARDVESDPDLVSVTFRDLADGATVPPGALGFSAGEAPLTAADGGWVMARSEVEHGDMHLGERYRYAGRIPEEGGARHYDVWAYRNGVVRGVVRLAPGAEISARDSVRVESTIRPGRRGVLPEDESPPWTEEWLFAHGFRSRSREQGVDRAEDDGSYELSVRLVRGLMIIARPPDASLAPDVQRVDVSADTDEVVLDLQLREQPCVAGTVTFPDDSIDPTTCRISIRTDRTLAISDFDYWVEHARGQGMSGGVRQCPEDFSVDVSFLASGALVGQDGAFRLPFLHDVGGLLRVEAPGCIPEEIPLGEHAAARSGVDVTLRRAAGAQSLQLLLDGEPLGRGTLRLLDDDRYAETGRPESGPIRISRNGTVNAAGLEDGRPYLLVIRSERSGTHRGWITWVGQRSVDVASDLRSTK